MTMRKITVNTGSAEEFFKRGRDIARKVDRGESLEPEHTLTFEDLDDLKKFKKLMTKHAGKLFFEDQP